MLAAAGGREGGTTSSSRGRNYMRVVQQDPWDPFIIVVTTAPGASLLYGDEEGEYHT